MKLPTALFAGLIAVVLAADYAITAIPDPA